jgi:hypothetical protein
MPVQVAENQTMCILVENQGRIAYGIEIKDFKVSRKMLLLIRHFKNVCSSLFLFCRG